MKLSISLRHEDIEFLDRQTDDGVYPSRSAVVQAAIKLLRDRSYLDSYAAAWDEWDESDDAVAWNVVSADGAR